MSEATPIEGSEAGWVLTGSLRGGRRLWSVPIASLPFRIGRSPDLELTLHSDSVSTEHAEIYRGEDSLCLRDLSSTNGTFVNRERVDDSPIRDGDILHFADLEFRFARQTQRSPATRATTQLADFPLPQRFVDGTRELGELLRAGSVTTYCQPIVELPTGTVIGYEALGRGRHDRLPEDPVELFRIASSLGNEVALSRLFRAKALEQVGHRSDLKILFLNTHPAELMQLDLITSLERLPESAPGLRLTIEIHEAAIVNVAHISRLRARLSELGMGLAYDDFGLGQARLLELADVPPDYLKFDSRFIRGIREAPPSRRQLLGSLIAVARDLGVSTLAEGVETPAEAEACVTLGFTHAQGFHYFPPVPFEQL